MCWSKNIVTVVGVVVVVAVVAREGGVFMVVAYDALFMRAPLPPLRRPRGSMAGRPC